MRQTQRSPRIPCAVIHNLIGSPVPALAALFLLLTPVSWAQVSLGLSSTGDQSGIMALNIVLNSVTGSEPASLEWTLAYPAANVTQAVVTAGPQAAAAVKSVTCKAASGSQICVLEGLNSSKILNGIVATATLHLSSTTTGTPSGIQVTNAMGASPAGKVVTVSTGSLIQTIPTIGSLQCPTTVLTLPASASCTVTLSAPAPAAGSVVALGVAATGITFTNPASVTLTSGQTTATYTVSVTAASTTSTVVTAASLNGSFVSSSFKVQPVPPIRVNSGGQLYTDTNGNLWSADYGYSSGGSTASTAATIAGTYEQGLYRTSRFQSGTLQYQFSMLNGTHTVSLKFAETQVTSVGQRVFNVILNGRTVLTNLDVFALAGANKALVLPYLVPDTTGAILIQLVGVVGNPSINAIEIIP
jgi:hypothetical protein